MFVDFTILLVDDDEDDRLVFQEALHFLGLDVKIHQASNGLEALNLIQAENFNADIMFFDLNMPRMNGFELLNAVRKDASFNKIPIVIYSTSNRPEDINRSLKCGANSYFPKPSSFNLLCDDLMMIFKKHLPNQGNGNTP